MEELIASGSATVETAEEMPAFLSDGEHLPGLSTITLCEDYDEALKRLKESMQKSYNDSKDDDIFGVGLSGSSMVDSVCLTLPKLSVDNWSKWRFFFCDERMVSFDDRESTYGCYLAKLPKHLGINSDQFIPINNDLDGDDCARDYQEKIEEILPKRNGLPFLHLALLGMGPDGHTCSLFPNHSLLSNDEQLVAFIGDSPKPPPKRVTMTLKMVNNSKNAIMLATGSSKAEAIKKILKEKIDLPAGLIKPTDGSIEWIVDMPAFSGFMNS